AGALAPAAAVADRAGVVHDQTAPAAVAARLGEGEAAQVAARRPGALAGGADPRGGARLRSRAAAGPARRGAGEPQRHGRAFDRLAERQRHLGLDVLTTACPAGRGGASATVEQPAEQVADPVARPLLADAAEEIEGEAGAARAAGPGEPAQA